MQWCLPLRLQQTGMFVSAVDAAKSGETSGNVNSNSSEMEMNRRTSGLMQQG
jgi:hypothetical protein